MDWEGWPLARVLILFDSLVFLFVGIQVTMSHYRQNFHHKAMWIPVIAIPLFVGSGIVLTFNAANWARGLFALLMWIGSAAGFLGFYYHFRGVGIRVGGYELRNFLMGPPIIMPLLITALSVLGLIAVYWD